MLKTENYIPRSRYLIVNGLVILLVSVLLGRFFQLQIFNYERYRLKSESNIIRVVSVPAPRGLILDREGGILVDNHSTYVLYAIPRELGDRGAVFQKISSCANIPAATLQANYAKYYRGQFLPVQIAKDLNIEQLGRIEEHKSELPGILYKQFPERNYSPRLKASHLLGYIREVDEHYLRNKRPGDRVDLGDFIGWRGLEKTYEKVLVGIPGVTYVQVDALGRETGKVGDRPDLKPVPGRNLLTTVDSDLQQSLESLLNGVKGAGIVSIPETGEILALVSVPDYAPDVFTGATPDSVWKRLIDASEKPLLNRVTQGLYPAGSTLKPIIILGLLEKHAIDTNKTVDCRGKYQLGNRTFNCWEEKGHGRVNMRQAVERSCNIYFYHAIQLLNLDIWSEISKSFGFHKPTGIDLSIKLSGNTPDVEFMNRKYGVGGWTKGHLLNIALGQGDILVTPLQMLMYINQIATRGQARVLHLAAGSSPLPETRPVYSDQIWDLLHSYLSGVVHGSRGTGRSANPRIRGVAVAGKTGTAENPHGEPHAWFVGWARKDAKMVSVVILIENAGHGGDIAAPIARQVFRSYFQKYAVDQDPLAAG